MSRFTLLTTRLALLNSTFPRTTPGLAIAASRSISSTAPKAKGALDATKDTLKKADRVVSDAAVKGINKGEHVLKDNIGIGKKEASAKSEQVKGEAASAASQGKQKAEEVAGSAKGKSEEILDEAKNKAREAERKL